MFQAWGESQYKKKHLNSIGILIFTMGIPTPGKAVFILKQGPQDTACESM